MADRIYPRPTPPGSAISGAGQHGALPVRRIGVPDLRRALRAGWEDFREHPTTVVFIGILYPVLGLLLSRIAIGENVLPLLYPMIAGFALVGPFAAIGLYELSRRREQGLPANWWNSFEVLRSPAIGGIAVLGVMLTALFLLWLRVAYGLWLLVFDGALPPDFGAMLGQVVGTAPGWRLLVLGNLVGALFAALALMLSVVSFPLLIDRNVGVETAIRTSVRAVQENPGTMAIWGVIVAGLLVLGMLPLMVGLAVAMPVLGHATWHLYRRIVPG